MRKRILRRTREIFNYVPELKQFIFPFLKKVSLDECSGVRESLSLELGVLIQMCNTEEVDIWLFPIMRSLLCDRDRATKMATIGGLWTIYEKLGDNAITEALNPII